MYCWALAILVASVVAVTDGGGRVARWDHPRLHTARRISDYALKCIFQIAMFVLINSEVTSKEKSEATVFLSHKRPRRLVMSMHAVRNLSSSNVNFLLLMNIFLNMYT